MASTRSVSRPVASRKEVVFSRREIEALIADGRTIIIVDGKVLKVDAWLKYHPGGDKAIMHMVGRDATDEVNALHSLEARRRMDSYQIGRIEGRWTNFDPPIQGGKFRRMEVDGGLKNLQEELDSVEDDSSNTSSQESSPVFEATKPNTTKRRKTEPYSSASSVTSVSSVDLEETKNKPGMSHIDPRTKSALELETSDYPPIDPDVQDEITRKYRQLGEKMKAENLYNCNYAAYGIECCRYLLLFATFIFLLRTSHFALSGIALGMLWHQLVFTVHDAGHMGITHNYQADSMIGFIIADYIGGLSLGWWKRNHNVHHIVTNHPEHDPDIQHMPFFAISSRFFSSMRSTYYNRIMTYDPFAQFVIRYQNYLYYPILTFGRFNLYRLSWEYLLLGQGPRKGPAWWHRYFELVGQVFFWTWFGYGVVYCSIPSNWDRFVFVLLSHAITMPVHVQITLSHFAMTTEDLGTNESFAQKMLRTTMDVDCPQWLDFFHGGLQFQAVHHLFPRLPRHNLRRAQKLVMEFCEDAGIPYALYGFADGNKAVIGRLGEVARQARILAECQKHMVESGDWHMD
ncbi:fatty acid/sphingolipid desaturase [Aulographum hederae CBS 113979]|uniref:Delta 8-(E)-sphingolipid desaturase n=1 Tax=Aulographum hederae CBS 113979 TaxID=1176131 RepID=A0A6G1GUH8_9PEZI|nr:fatty acid/sphingolipid desaturase [Aulographum hederae CBS 113979]